MTSALADAIKVWQTTHPEETLELAKLLVDIQSRAKKIDDNISLLFRRDYIDHWGITKSNIRSDTRNIIDVLKTHRWPKLSWE